MANPEAVEDEDIEEGEITPLWFRHPAAVNSVVHMDASPLNSPETSEKLMTFGDKGNVVVDEPGVTRMANLNEAKFDSGADPTLVKPVNTELPKKANPCN
ncbi:hypothetical protein CDL15_Pgr027692 [Punica granatum]|uniref:Uncharacterized protein n=1 Tax=Punica granatum TaxID=22663 RepID=A0A218XI75_PUNGR|nr:hypothetical protein CDL15_Pgr027692 [Punica granatum]